jgi:hypothetical protein
MQDSNSHNLKYFIQTLCHLSYWGFEIYCFFFQNLYGYAQMQKLPSGKFRWLNKCKTLNFDINSIDSEGKYGYFIECDLEYPKEIHDLQENLPLAPEVLEINYDSLSPYAQTALIESDGGQKYKDVKLMATFADRINYITHSKNLKLYLDLGMKLKKIHRKNGEKRPVKSSQSYSMTEIAISTCLTVEGEEEGYKPKIATHLYLKVR